MTLDDTTVTQLVLRVLDTGCTPEAACRDSPELLAQVREQLRLIQMLDAEVEAVFPSSDSALLDDASHARSVESLPHVPGHEVLSLLGHGGMGIVYAARHLRLNRTVAVKMLLQGAHTDAVGLKRLVREAEAVAALHHPNIVQVHEVGEHEGLPYFTMELVEGGSLRDKIERHILDAREAASLVASLASAIAVAHENGIVHRDLKPANVLLTTDGVPKIVDFGLARRIDGDSSLTGTGAHVGTPSYMSPEQALGGSRAIGPATDIYALGAILYAALTGRPPFRSNMSVVTLGQVIEDEPARPSRLVPRVPRDLETICLKCLSDPTRRYVTASALAEDLQRFLRGEPIVARPFGLPERMLKWVRRRPAHATIVAGAVLALLALAGAGLWLGIKRAALERAAVADLLDADRAAAGANWPLVRTALERARARLADGGSAELIAQVEQGVRELALVEQLDAIRLQRADIPYQMKARSNNSALDAAYERAFDGFGLDDVPERPSEIAQRVRASRIRAALVAALDTWATCVTGDDTRRDGLLAAVRLADPDPSGWRDRVRDPASWTDLQALDVLMSEAPLAGESVMLLLALAEHVVVAGGDAVPFLARIQREHPDDFWANSTLGVRLAEQAETDPAPIRYFQAAVAVRPDDAYSRANLGSALGAAGHLAEAEIELRMAIRVDPKNVQAHSNLSTCLKKQGRIDEAMEELRILMHLERSVADTARRLLIVEWLIDLCRLDEAIVEAREGLRLDPRSFELHMRLGYALHGAGLLEEACEVLRNAITIESRTATHEMLGLVLEDMGRVDDAIDSLRRALHLDASRVLVRNHLMSALIRRGRIEEARTEARLLLQQVPAGDPSFPAAKSVLNLCELINQLEAELPAVLDGSRVPRSIRECLAFADLFRGKQDYRAAARHYTDAFERFGQRPSWSSRTFDAARCAALAGTAGVETGNLAPEEERAMWRSNALDLLRIGLDVFGEALAADAPGSRLNVQWGLMEMKTELAFAPLRDAALLDQLSSDERALCRALWSDVDALSGRARSVR